MTNFSADFSHGKNFFSPKVSNLTDAITKAFYQASLRIQAFLLYIPRAQVLHTFSAQNACKKSA
jgi:hypothetical protein